MHLLDSWLFLALHERKGLLLFSAHYGICLEICENAKQGDAEASPFAIYRQVVYDDSTISKNLDSIKRWYNSWYRCFAHLLDPMFMRLGRDDVNPSVSAKLKRNPATHCVAGFFLRVSFFSSYLEALDDAMG